MIKNILNETKHVKSYEYDNTLNIFKRISRSDLDIFRSLAELVGILSKYDIEYTVDHEYNIALNIVNNKV